MALPLNVRVFSETEVPQGSEAWNPNGIAQLALRDLADEGRAILMVEHDMDLVFSFAKRITVLVNGALLTEGTPEQIAADPQVKAVYLGDVAAEVASHRPSTLHHAHDPAEAPHG